MIELADSAIVIGSCSISRRHMPGRHWLADGAALERRQLRIVAVCLVDVPHGWALRPAIMQPTHRTSCRGSTSVRTSPRTRGRGTCPCSRHTHRDVARFQITLWRSVASGLAITMRSRQSSCTYEPISPVQVLRHLGAHACCALLRLLSLHCRGLRCCHCAG